MKACFLFLSLLIAVPALAGDLYYLKPESVNLVVVPAPPVTNSAQDKADLDKVIELQGKRTEAECTRATVEAEGFANSFFGGVYGPLSDLEAKRLVEFQERLFNEVNFYARILKVSFSRARPFDRDVQIKPCIPLQKSNSYPSGHAAVSYVAAKSFSLIYPALAKKFLQRAEVIASDRVLGGVHHPSDVVAGRILGEEIFSALRKNQKFLDDLKELAP
jgi:acid phosphatase (class A)